MRAYLRKKIWRLVPKSLRTQHAGSLMINERNETDFLDDILYTVVTIVSCTMCQVVFVIIVMKTVPCSCLMMLFGISQHCSRLVSVSETAANPQSS